MSACIFRPQWQRRLRRVAVTQILLPGVSTRRRGIRAELYKLNVYSRPSDKFKAHVDTPRGKDRSVAWSFVFLLRSKVRYWETVSLQSWHDKVVSLRSEHGRPAIHWAAFYSDCEHEVLTVTAGHRITLTYNLYVSAGTGLLADKTDNLDPMQLPLYRSLLLVSRSSSACPVLSTGCWRETWRSLCFGSGILRSDFGYCLIYLLRYKYHRTQCFITVLRSQH